MRLVAYFLTARWLPVEASRRPIKASGLSIKPHRHAVSLHEIEMMTPEIAERVWGSRREKFGPEGCVYCVGIPSGVTTKVSATVGGVVPTEYEVTTMLSSSRWSMMRQNP